LRRWHGRSALLNRHQAASSFREGGPDIKQHFSLLRFARLGDVILLLPAFASIKSSFPDAKLSFLTGHRCASIAEMCPAVDDVISVDRIAMRDGPPWKGFTHVRTWSPTFDRGISMP
jgi:hypothetical protein